MVKADIIAASVYFLYGVCLDCLECMACSDNVVRAGLTPKFKDVTTLCDILDYRCRPFREHIFSSEPHPFDSFVTVYDPPVPEFTVEQITVSAFYLLFPLCHSLLVTLLIVLKNIYLISNVKYWCMQEFMEIWWS